MRIGSSFVQQETARALHDQDHFSWKAMWLSGLQNALTAGISARLGIPNPNLKQIFITNIEKSEEIAFSVQIFLYATRIEKHFDWKAIITAALQPIANTIIQIGVPVIPTNALQQMSQTFVDDAISQEVVNHHIDMEYAAADALGSFTGNLIHYQMMQRYQAWQSARDQKLYQQWLQQQQQQKRIEELNEEENKIDAEIKKLNATINSNDNNDDSNNKNPSYQQRQQQHNDTTSRAQRWNQTQTQPTFWQKLDNVYEGMGAFAEGESSSVYSNPDVNVTDLSPDQQMMYAGGAAAGLSEAITFGGAIASAALGVFGIFGEAVEDIAGGLSAVNHINALRYRQQLQTEQAKSIFTEDGKLTPEVIQDSFPLYIRELKNPDLLEELSAQPGNISDWEKYTTQNYLSPSGNFQMHFYQNNVTKDVYYGMDYKAVFDHQGEWNNLESSPNFTYEPPQFNP